MGGFGVMGHFRWPIAARFAVRALLVALVVVVSAAAAAAKPLTILMLGDSLTAGYGLLKGESLPERLEAALKREGLDVDVVNAGVSGDTSAGGRARLGWALSENPDAVIVALGANDGLRGLQPEETRANLGAIVERARTRGLPVLLAGMRAPPNLGREYGAEFEAVYEELAAAHDILTYPFLLEGVAAQPHLNQDDRIHPNARGVEVIVERLLPFVRQLIGRVGG